jgi:hypothetical protein
MVQKRKNNFKKKKPKGTASTGSVWDVKFIEKELQKQVHPSAAGPSPVAQKCKKNSSNTHPRQCWYRQCSGASSSLIKSCKHKSVHQLLGLIQWLKNEKNMKKCSTKTLPVPAVPWASSSLKKSCKHKFIHQLLGHIQWLKNEKKNSSYTHPRHCQYRQCLGASS